MAQAASTPRPGEAVRAAPADATGGAEDDARSLADAYADRHERLDNFIVMYAVPKALLARSGIDLHSGPGYALLFVALFAGIVVPALVLAAITSSADTPPPKAVVIGASLAALNVLALGLAQAAAFKISALHRALVDPAQIRSLVRWDRRWYSPTMSALAGGALGLVYLVILYVLTLVVTGIRLSPPTIWLCAVIATFLGQFSFSTAMILFEFRRFTSCRFRLYPFSPISTRALQQTSEGLKELGLVSVVLLPLFCLVLLAVLPPESGLNLPITAGFLFISYLATALGILLPLAFLGTVVRAEKWRQLEPLQERIGTLAASAAMLDGVPSDEFTRLQALHDAIAGSKDTLLDVGAVVRIAAAAVLSTMGLVGSSLLQLFLQRAL